MLNNIRNTTDSIISKALFLLRLNLRVIVALGLLTYFTYPVINKVVEVSKTKSFFAANASKTLEKLPQLKLTQFNSGVFDPNSEFKNQSGITYTQFFHSWDYTLEQKTLEKALDTTIRSKRHPFITIEPWGYTTNVSNDQYLAKIIAGDYDKHIINTCKKIKEFNELTLVNWAEGADFGAGSRYSWGTNNTNLYKDAYKRWHDKCKQVANNIIFVWTAFGNKNSESYYPGDEYVDILGLNIQILSKDLPKTNNYAREVNKIITERIKNVQNVNRFIYITDFAIENATENKVYTTEFIKLFKSQSISNILGVIYINTDQSPSQKQGVKSLDYRLDPKTFSI
jgi:endoglucanase